MLLAIVGKRNAGKSTLVNAIARLYQDEDERVIVSELPGTTRDSIDVRFEKDGKTLIVIDTAGRSAAQSLDVVVNALDRVPVEASERERLGSG